MADDSFLYFGYGSNLLTTRLRARTPSAIFHAKAILPEHRLTFSKVSIDRSGKCHVEPAEDDASVLGIVFRIQRSEKAALDTAEGLGAGYEERTLRVTTDTGEIEVLAYAASPDRLDSARRPYHWYKALVLAGATEHDLPRDYVDSIRAVASIPDPLPQRPTKLEAEAALEAAGYPIPANDA